MPNQIPAWFEERIVAFSPGHPGLGARRIAADLRTPMRGGLVVSGSGVTDVLHRHGLNTRRRRLALVGGYAAPPEPAPRQLPELHREADIPGDLVQFDCFYVGRIHRVQGRIWQYTAIDVTSSFLWTEFHRTPLNPAARFTSALARRVAADLAAAGWNMRCSPTTAPNSSRLCSAPPSLSSARSTASSEQAGHRPMGVWSESGAPS